MYPYMSDSFCIVPVIAPASPVTALLAMKKSPIGTVRFSMTRAASQSVQSRAEMRFGRKRKKRLFSRRKTSPRSSCSCCFPHSCSCARMTFEMLVMRSSPAYSRPQKTRPAYSSLRDISELCRSSLCCSRLSAFVLNRPNIAGGTAKIRIMGSIRMAKVIESTAV